MKQILNVMILISLVGCHGFKSNQSIDETGLNQDTIKTVYFMDIAKQDSIKILDFNKFSQDTFKQERIIYIDYKYNNDDRKKVLNFNIEKLKSEIVVGTYQDSIKNDFASSIKDLNNTYVMIKKYKQEYCLYYFDIYFSKTITDTSIIFNDMDGISSYRLTNVKMDENKYVYEFANNPYKIKQIVAKVIDSKMGIQIWQDERVDDKNESMFSYEMVIPAKMISKIPILYTLTNDMVDQSYDKFDDIDLEKLFKK